VHVANIVNRTPNKPIGYCVYTRSIWGQKAGAAFGAGAGAETGAGVGVGVGGMFTQVRQDDVTIRTTNTSTAYLSNSSSNPNSAQSQAQSLAESWPS